MLNFHDEFLEFDNKIKLTTARRNNILSSRDAVREKIRQYFNKELAINKPLFRVQGSFTINTTLNPIDDNEVDIDDGVYLQHIDSEEIQDWPSPKEAHETICNALDGHTQDGCESKTCCIRVLYKNIYHLDLPVYIMKGDKAFLAQTKVNEWVDSDSKAFKDWFYENRQDIQTTRIVRYLKAWRDYLELGITSIELTILAVKCHVVYSERDDVSFLETVKKIQETVKRDKFVKKPVSPFENLWNDLDDKQRQKRLDDYSDLYNDVNDALSNSSNSRASNLLVALFGSRFPLKDDAENKVYIQTTTGAKPWGS